MPRKRRASGSKTSRRPKRGEGFMDILKSANNFLKKTKLISTVAGALGGLPGGFGGIAGTVGNVAGSMGYGRRRRTRRGGAHVSVPLFSSRAINY